MVEMISISVPFLSFFLPFFALNRRTEKISSSRLSSLYDKTWYVTPRRKSLSVFRMVGSFMASPFGSDDVWKLHSIELRLAASIPERKAA